MAPGIFSLRYCNAVALTPPSVRRALAMCWSQGKDCHWDGLAKFGQSTSQSHHGSIAWHQWDSPCRCFYHPWLDVFTAPGTSCLGTPLWPSSRSIPSGSVEVGDSIWFRKGMMPCSCTRMYIPVGLWLIAMVKPIYKWDYPIFHHISRWDLFPRPSRDSPHPEPSIVHIQNPNGIYTDL